MESVTGTKSGQKYQAGAMLSAEIGKYTKVNNCFFKLIIQR